MTQRIDFFVFFFPKMTQIFEFFIWLKELNLLLWTSFQYDSKRWSFVFFSFWLKELKPFVFPQNVSKNWTSLSYELLFDTTQRIEFFQYDAKIFSNLTQKSWTHFFPWLKEMTLFLPKWRTELNPYFECDAKDGTLFSLNTTQRIEPFFLWIRRRELNPFFFEYDAENWILSLWIWRKELKALFIMTRRIEPSRKLLKDLNLLFWTWLKESNPFFEYDSKFENFWLKNGQNIELFPKNYDSKNWFFLKKMMQSFFFWKKSDSKNGTFLKIWLSNKNMTQIIEPFLLWFGEFFFKTQRIELFFKYGSKNWTSFV